MPLKEGTTAMTALYVGTTPLVAAYVGTTQIFPSSPPISITGPVNYYSSGAVGGSARFKSVTTSLSVSGGTGSYTYSWAKMTEDLFTATPTSASNAAILNPTFSSSVQPDGGAEATWRLTVTSGSQVATYDVSISLNN